MTYIDPAARARMDDCRNRLADLRKQRAQAQTHVEACRQALQTVQASGVDLTKTSEFHRAEQAVKDVNEVALKIGSVEAEESYLLTRISGVDGSGSGESFLNDVNTLEELRQLASSSAPVGTLNLGTLVSRDQWMADHDRRQMMAAAGDVAIPDTARVGTYQGIIPQLRRRLRLLDLIPTSPMDSASFDYTQESGTFDSAAETAELSVKPSATLTLTDAQVVARTIAHWLRIPRQQLADVPQLGQTMNDRLVYGVNRRLENQVLGGDGTGNNLTGIIHTSGIGAPASVTGDTVNTDLVLNAIGSVLASEADPNAVCLNEADAIKALKVKASGSGQRLDSPGAFAAALANLTLWGLPVIISSAIASGHALVGDFTLGCRIYVREGVNVRISDSDQSDFIENAIKCLAEGRFGLAVWQPSVFAYIPLSFAA